MSEKAVDRLFDTIRDGIVVDESDSVDFGPFTAGYHFALHLEGGDIDLRSDGSISLSELDVVLDAADVYLGIDIPEQCIGGDCILPTPWGCAVRLPRLCIFSDDPDLAIALDLSWLRSEISARLAPVVKYSTNPGRTGTMNDWDAFDAGVPNHWQLYVDPITLDLDLFDFADIIGDILEEAIEDALRALLWWLPDWAMDLVLDATGPLVDLVRDILDVGDDVEEWLSNLLGVSFGIFDIILTAVLDALASTHPLIEFEDPVKALDGVGPIVPVLVPIEYVGVDVTDTELTLSVDIGG